MLMQASLLLVIRVVEREEKVVCAGSVKKQLLSLTGLVAQVVVFSVKVASFV